MARDRNGVSGCALAVHIQTRLCGLSAWGCLETLRWGHRGFLDTRTEVIGLIPSPPPGAPTAASNTQGLRRILEAQLWAFVQAEVSGHPRKVHKRYVEWQR